MCVYISQIDISLQIPHECASARLDSTRLCSVCATQSRGSACGVVQILATRSGLPSPRSGLALGGASYSVPVYLLSLACPPTRLLSRSVKSLCLQLELFLFFLFLYIFFCRCCCCAWPGAFCFMLGIMDFYVTSFWFRFSPVA